MSKKKNDERVVIDLSQIPELHKLSDTALKAVSEKSTNIYQMNGKLIRLVFTNDRIKIERLDKYALRREVSKYTKIVENSKCLKEKHPHMNIINDAMATETYPFYEIKGISRHPIISKNGEIKFNTGYDNETNLFIYNKFNFNFNNISNKSNISKEEITSAKNVIFDLLSDFTFKSPSDLTNYIGFILVILCRSFFDGLIPLHLIKASTPGTGKTLLSEIPYLILTGERPAITSLPDNESEMRKTIFSFLMSGVESVIFDNVKSRVSSGVLAAILTSGKYGSRILSKSQFIDYNVRFPIIITANNPDVDKELARRIVPIELVTTMENPALRNNFKYQDIRKHIIDNRFDYLTAFLTIIKFWFLSGKKEWLGKNIGSFEGFCRLIGGILETSEFPEFLYNYEGFYNSIDYEFDIWRAFVFKWYEKYGVKPILAQNITDIALETDFIDKNNRDGSLTRQLGKQLSKKADTIISTEFGNLRLMRGKTVKRAQLWYLENKDKGRE
jgi:hypothetical protein